MHIGKTVFAQLMTFIPEYEFQKCAEHYKGDCRVKKLICREHFLVMSFSQFTGRESLRDIATYTYLLIATTKKKLDLAITLYTFAQTLGLPLFEKPPIKELFNDKNLINNLSDENQLSLWEF